MKRKNQKEETIIQQRTPYALQHLPFSQATFSGNPGRLVVGDTFPGRHLLALFEPSDIDGVRALRWGRNDRALCWQNPSNTGNVPPLLALANNGQDLILSVGHTRGGVGA
nr:hypothetical protein [Tanacetum cinerariifolium]